MPKRSQPRSETPKPAFQVSGQQFQATPRFSLQSTPRLAPGSGPSSSLTPFRHRDAELDIVVDSSPPPAPSADGVDDGHHIKSGRGYEQIAIHDDDDDASMMDDDDGVVRESSPIREESIGRDHPVNEGRRVKRRRISISPPDFEFERPSPIPEVEYEPDAEMDDLVDINSSFPALPSSGTHTGLGKESHKDDDDDVEDVEDLDGGPIGYQEARPLGVHQPIFQKAPRFKPAEIPEGAPHPEPLPDTFSPRRKGAKYVAGGLAAELRNWLVDVEAGISSGPSMGSGAKRDEEWVARIRVDSLRSAVESARGMTLVLGRQVLNGGSKASGEDRHPGEDEGTAEILGTNTVRLILAGPGRLSGLGVGHKVRPGVLLGIGRPTWEVVLDDLGRWGVACDWAVLR